MNQGYVASLKSRLRGPPSGGGHVNPARAQRTSNPRASSPFLNSLALRAVQNSGGAPTARHKPASTNVEEHKDYSGMYHDFVTENTTLRVRRPRGSDTSAVGSGGGVARHQLGDTRPDVANCSAPHSLANIAGLDSIRRGLAGTSVAPTEDWEPGGPLWERVGPDAFSLGVDGGGHAGCAQHSSGVSPERAGPARSWTASVADRLILQQKLEYLNNPRTQLRHAMLQRPRLLVAEALATARKRSANGSWVDLASQRLGDGDGGRDDEQPPRRPPTVMNRFPAKAQRLLQQSQVCVAGCAQRVI